MDHWFEKKELQFVFLWIAIYVLAFSVSDSISDWIGIIDCVTLPVSLLIGCLLIVWVKRVRKEKYYGLCKLHIEGLRQYLYFLPLLIVATPNLWAGITRRHTILNTILYVLTMCVVGFIEEVIFRGMLLNAMMKKNQKNAIIISSLTFGMGHIVNLLNGAKVLENTLQLCYATAIGYLFCILYLKSKSLVLCIILHAFINASSAFSAAGSTLLDIITCIVLVVVSFGYAKYLKRNMNWDERKT